MQTKTPSIQVSDPKLFTARAVAVVNAYGVLLATPIFVAVLVVSVMKFSVLTVLIPLLTLGLTMYLLPFGFGNTHVIRLVRSLAPAAGTGVDSVVVQITLSPRIRTGLRALLEDADDIGYLTFTAEELVYRGDSVQLRLPYDQIQRVEPQGTNLRLPFIHGWRIRLTAAGLAGVEWVEFAERSSCVLPTSWAVARKLNQRLIAMSPRTASTSP